MLAKDTNEHANKANILEPRMPKLLVNLGRDELERQQEVEGEADPVVNDGHGRHGALDEDGLVQPLTQVHHQYIATDWDLFGIFILN